MRCLIAGFDDEKLRHDDWSKVFKYLETSTHRGGARENGFQHSVLG